jgi:hypothetical protein
VLTYDCDKDIDLVLANALFYVPEYKNVRPVKFFAEDFPPAAPGAPPAPAAPARELTREEMLVHEDYERLRAGEKICVCSELYAPLVAFMAQPPETRRLRAAAAEASGDVGALLFRELTAVRPGQAYAGGALELALAPAIALGAAVEGLLGRFLHAMSMYRRDEHVPTSAVSAQRLAAETVLLRTHLGALVNASVAVPSAMAAARAAGASAAAAAAGAPPAAEPTHTFSQPSVLGGSKPPPVVPPMLAGLFAAAADGEEAREHGRPRDGARAPRLRQGLVAGRRGRRAHDGRAPERPQVHVGEPRRRLCTLGGSRSSLPRATWPPRSRMCTPMWQRRRLRLVVLPSELFCSESSA